MVSVNKSFRVIIHLLPTGERFPLLVSSETGVPPVMALRYALSRRMRGSSERLRQLLRGVRDLYEWCGQNAALDLDQFLLEGKMPEVELLDRALKDFDTADYLKISRHDSPDSPDVESNSREMIHNARAHNKRARAWKDFLLWALYPRNWKSRYDPEEAQSRRPILREIRLDLELFFEDAFQHEPESAPCSGLSVAELEAIELAIGPDASGLFPNNGFNVSLRLRNWLMYCLARWGGLRRGEILKLQVKDIPVRDKIGPDGRMGYSSFDIQVVRRPDDLDDPRVVRSPSVKRGSRSVTIPESLLDDLHSYLKARAEACVASPYVFVTGEGQPLSIERADDIIKQIGRYAAKIYLAKYPLANHTLDQLTWHRLRHTRAMELLPEFMSAGPTGIDEFLSFFGWVSLASADPYIRELHHERAGALIRNLNAHLNQK